MHTSRKPVSFSKIILLSLLILSIVLLLFMSMPTSSDAADLSCNSSEIYFGVVMVGETAYQTLTLTNEDGFDPITVKDIVSNFNKWGSFGWSKAVTLPAVIYPGESMEIKLSFKPEPTSMGIEWADLYIHSDSGNHPSLYIYLSGVVFNR